MKRRQVFSSVILLLVIVLLSGTLVNCAPPPPVEVTPEEVTPETEEVAPAPEEVTLRVAMVAVPETEKSLELLDEFYAKYPNIKIEVTQIGVSDMEAKLYIDLTTDPGTYDMVTMPGTWAGGFRAAGLLQPAERYVKAFGEDEVKAMYPEAVLNSTGARDRGGVWWGLPWRYDGKILFYNIDMLKEAGFVDPPETWDQFREYAIKLTDPAKKQYGAVLETKKGNRAEESFSQLMYAWGGKFFDEKWEPLPNREAAVAALQWEYDLIWKDKVMPLGVIGFGQEEVVTSFAQGETAMVYHWPFIWAISQDPEKSRIVGKVGISHVPFGKAPGVALGGWHVALTSGAKHPDEAFLFMQWLTSDEVQKKQLLNGGDATVPNIKVLTDPEALEFAPVLKPLYEGAAQGFWYPNTTVDSQWRDIFGTYIGRALAGELSPQEAMDKAATEMREVMVRAGYIKG